MDLSRRFKKLSNLSQVSNNDHALTVLGNAIVVCIEQAVGNVVTQPSKVSEDFFKGSLVTIEQDPGNILSQKEEWSLTLENSDVLEEQLTTGIGNPA